MQPAFYSYRAFRTRLPSPAPSASRAPAAGLAPRLVLGLVLAGVLALPVSAGLVLTGVTKVLDGSEKPTEYIASVDEGKVRLETKGENKGLFIFRADKGLFWSVDNTHKTYTEMTKKDIENMAAQMQAAAKQMEEQMKNLPPEQRAMMEEAMGGLGAKPAKVSYRKIGAGKAGTLPCDNYEVLADGKKRAEICWVEPAKSGLTMADYRTITDLVKPFENIARDLQTMFPQPGVNGAPEGIPMKSVEFAGGKPVTESVVKDIRKETLAPSVFELPKGLTKQSFKQGQGIPGAG